MIDCTTRIISAKQFPPASPGSTASSESEPTRPRKSHADLDASQLDIGDPAELGRQYQDLRSQLPNLRVFGGCCGTDHRHIVAICKACL